MGGLIRPRTTHSSLQPSDRPPYKNKGIGLVFKMRAPSFVDFWPPLDPEFLFGSTPSRARTGSSRGVAFASVPRLRRWALVPAPVWSSRPPPLCRSKPPAGNLFASHESVARRASRAATEFHNTPRRTPRNHAAPTQLCPRQKRERRANTSAHPRAHPPAHHDTTGTKRKKTSTKYTHTAKHAHSPGYSRILKFWRTCVSPRVL